MDDQRKEYLLEPGDQITCDNGEIYTIEKVIGLGGTSVVYSCTEEERKEVSPEERRRMIRNGIPLTNESKIHYAIKECFPYHGYTRKEGRIVPEDSMYDQFDQLCDAFRNEIEFTHQISNTTGRASLILKQLSVSRVYHGKNYDRYDGAMNLLADLSEKGCFLNEILEECKQERNSHFYLRNGGLPLFEVTLAIIKQVLLAVETVHQLGYIHSDIQPGNVFLLDCKLEAIHNQNDFNNYLGNGMLIDYTSTQKLIHGKTEELNEVYASPGYRAPEMSKLPCVLTPAADIYSIGMLLYYLITGDPNISSYEGVIREDLLAINNRKLKEIGFNIDYRDNLFRILKKALNEVPELRYQTCKEMIDDLDHIYSIKPIQGRTEEVEMIKNATNPLVIHARAGMGKTTLVKYASVTLNGVYIYFDACKKWEDIVIGELYKGVTHKQTNARSKKEALNEFNQYQKLPLVFIDACTTLSSEVITEIIQDYPNVVITCDNDIVDPIDGVTIYPLQPLEWDNSNLNDVGEYVNHNTMALGIINQLVNSTTSNHKTIDEIKKQLDTDHKESIQFESLLKMCRYSGEQLFSLFTNVILPSVQHNALHIAIYGDMNQFKPMIRYYWLNGEGQYVDLHMNTIIAFYELLKKDSSFFGDNKNFTGCMLKMFCQNNDSIYDRDLINAIAEVLIKGSSSYEPINDIDLLKCKIINEQNRGYSTIRGTSMGGIQGSKLFDYRKELAKMYELNNELKLAGEQYQNMIDDLLPEVDDGKIDPQVMCLLGDCYLGKDFEIAKILYTRAADQGNEYAKIQLTKFETDQEESN